MTANNGSFDCVIRNGLVVDGRGGAPFRGDVAVRGQRIVAVGKVAGKGVEEIDAADCLVTPGFVDVHTHYDGQAIWSSRMTPSSAHGVTTVVMGNCGVGFAPCRPNDHDMLVNSMEGVEDIPEIVMTKGLPWNWQTFPEFMDALASRPHDINIAAYIPHSPLRVYVMGERGARREPATADDLAQMAALVKEAMAAGAMGFATSRLEIHRRGDGEYIPSFEASENELQAIAGALRESGRGIIQMVPNFFRNRWESVRGQLEMMKRLSLTLGNTVTFTMGQGNDDPDGYRAILDWVREANQIPGVSLKPQVFPRSVGILLGHDLTINPFALNPSYLAMAHLPLDERLAELRKPEMRAKLLSETPTDPTLPLLKTAFAFEYTFPMGEPPNYEPSLESSMVAEATRRGLSPEEVIYDRLLEDDGRALLFVAAGSYGHGTLDSVLTMLEHPDTILGLGDGGAHYGMICDASYPTFMLTHWGRDRKGTKISVPSIIKGLCADPAHLLGLDDRGVIAPGYKADLNVIDHARMALHRPVVTHDLPAGGRRLDQTAEGYRYTMVNGRAIVREDQPTGSLPGELVRGTQQAIAA